MKYIIIVREKLDHQDLEVWLVQGDKLECQVQKATEDQEVERALRVLGANLVSWVKLEKWVKRVKQVLGENLELLDQRESR